MEAFARFDGCAAVFDNGCSTDILCKPEVASCNGFSTFGGLNLSIEILLQNSTILRLERILQFRWYSCYCDGLDIHCTINNLDLMGEISAKCSGERCGHGPLFSSVMENIVTEANRPAEIFTKESAVESPTTEDTEMRDDRLAEMFTKEPAVKPRIKGYTIYKIAVLVAASVVFVALGSMLRIFQLLRKNSRNITTTNELITHFNNRIQQQQHQQEQGTEMSHVNVYSLASDDVLGHSTTEYDDSSHFHIRSVESVDDYYDHTFAVPDVGQTAPVDDSTE